MIFSCIAMLMGLGGSDAVIGGDLFILQSSCDDSGIISGHGARVLTCVGTRGHKNIEHLTLNICAGHVNNTLRAVH